MGYELSIRLKSATLEIEFDDMDDLAGKLSHVDLPAIDRLVAQARRRKGAAKKQPARAPARKKSAARKR